MPKVRVRRGFTVTAAIVVLAGTLLLSAAPVRAATLCTGDKPESVLDCLVRAYESRDVEALEGLFAPDYTFVFGEASGSPSWSGADEVGSVSNLFRSSNVRSIRLEVVGNAEVLPGEDPETWVVRGVGRHLTVSTKGEGGEGGPQDYNVDTERNEFRVRWIAEPETHWQIFRWTDLIKA